MILPLPELKNADIDYSMLFLIQDEAFGPYTLPPSISPISEISRGR